MIGLLVAWLLSRQCPTDTAWIELPSQVPVCGDADGNAVSYPRILPDTGIVVFVRVDATPSLPQKSRDTESGNP